MIFGPFSDEFFWYDESESHPEFLDPWHDALSPQSPDDWSWEEWGDLVVFQPVGYESRYEYPLVIWLSLDQVSGVTLRDWFPDLSERNYVGAEVRLLPGSTILQNADRVAVALREVVALYGIHRQRVWIAGVGSAADEVLQLLPALSRLVSGGIAIAPCAPVPSDFHSTEAACEQTLYLATQIGDVREGAASQAEHWDINGGPCHLTERVSMDASRLALCRDLNAWLMGQVCAPAELESRG